MESTSSAPCRSTAVDLLSRFSTLTNLDAISTGGYKMPSPQAWLADSKRSSTPSFLDPPESPLDLLQPVRWLFVALHRSTDVITTRSQRHWKMAIGEDDCPFSLTGTGGSSALRMTITSWRRHLIPWKCSATQPRPKGVFR
jgi:hypothetical protein